MLTEIGEALLVNPVEPQIMHQGTADMPGDPCAKLGSEKLVVKATNLLDHACLKQRAPDRAA